MDVFKPQMCFAGLLMTLAEKKRAGKLERAVPGSSRHPLDPGWEGVSELGHRWTPRLSCCGEEDLGDTKEQVQARSPRAAAILGERFTHLGVVSSSWVNANVLWLSPLPRPKVTVWFKSPCPKFPASLCGRKE